MFLIYTLEMFIYDTFPNLTKVLGVNTENMEAPGKTQASQIQMKILAWFQWDLHPRNSRNRLEQEILWE